MPKTVYEINLSPRAAAILPRYTRFQPMALEAPPAVGDYFAGFEEYEEAANDRLLVVSVSPGALLIGLASEISS